MQKNKEWFETWFASPFYDVLYAHRDEAEAELFVKTLLCELPVPTGARILDLACGKGRHARAFAKRNNKVVGIDLTERFIAEARKIAKKENLNLQCFVQDIRNFAFQEKFHLIFNGFTSFGYFENPKDNEMILAKVYQHLLPKGFFVLDYLNSLQVKKNVPNNKREIRQYNEHTLIIEKEIRDNFVYKTIRILNPKQNSEKKYTERVRLFSREELQEMLERYALKTTRIWGDYYGNDYSENSSRMIFIAQKG